MIQWNFIPANLNGGMNCLKSLDYQGGWEIRWINGDNDTFHLWQDGKYDACCSNIQTCLERAEEVSFPPSKKV